MKKINIQIDSNGLIITIKKINWKTLQNIWETKLWKDRQSPIKPTNGLLLGGGWLKDIEQNTGTFFGVFCDNKLVGVNSGHKAELVNNKQYYRSRGIFVFPEYRGKGIAQMLLKAVQEQGILEGCTDIWSMPRESSLSTYYKAGFKLYSNNTAKGMEFGPNFYVHKKINN